MWPRDFWPGDPSSGLELCTKKTLVPDTFSVPGLSRKERRFSESNVFWGSDLPESSNLDDSGSGVCEMYMKFRISKSYFLTIDFNFPSHQTIFKTKRKGYQDMRFSPLLDKPFGNGY